MCRQPIAAPGSRLLALFALFALCALPLYATGQSAEPGSPASRRIDEVRRQIAARPHDASLHAALAQALARRARESADPDFYRQAEGAVAAALALEPQSLEARKARVWILLGKHEFAAALTEAEALHKLVPDDVQIYGYLVDGHVELGRYREAEENAQWMLDLRPGNLAALTRVSYLRELFGDVEGALEMMHLAFQRTPPSEVEDRAWIATQMSHLELMRGNVDLAGRLGSLALELFPDYHYALAQLAKVRVAERRFDAAVALLRRHVEAAAHPENYYGLGVALIKAGKVREGRALLVQFEAKARVEMHGWDNANRELVMYYVEHARQPAKALHVAQQEAARRQDVFTLEALAWALSASGKQQEARAAIDRALAVGIQEAGMYYRAGVIALRSGDRRAAAEFFQRCLQANPHSEHADSARSLALRSSPKRQQSVGAAVPALPAPAR